MERLVAVTKTYETGRPYSLVVIIPSEVRKLLTIRRGDRFAVKVDERGRVIYERIYPLKVRRGGDVSNKT